MPLFPAPSAISWSDVHADEVADHHDLNAAQDGVSAGAAPPPHPVSASASATSSAARLMEGRRVPAQPRDGDARLNQLQQAENGDGSGNGTPDPYPSSAPLRTQSQKNLKPCRYFGTPKGCRAGAGCPFLHDPSRLPEAAKVNNDGTSGASAAVTEREHHSDLSRRQQVVTEPLASRVVSKPIPQAQSQDPREFQLGQIRRRFSPRETRSLGNDGAEIGIILNFSMRPSDPDFPFDMDVLKCSLTVPLTYPGEDEASMPKLKVTNKDMPRGFAINIERGFDSLVEQRKDNTLLALMSALDKNLEKFLSEKKAETVKLVANADTRHLAGLPVRSVEPPLNQVSEKQGSNNAQSSVNQARPEEFFSNEQKTWATEKRERDVRQLEARMGRLPLYKKSSNGIVYTLPLEPFKRSELPVSLQSIKNVRLIVPVLYPLVPCRADLEGVDFEDAKVVETNFEQHAALEKDMTLMAHLQYLTHNIHAMAKRSPRHHLEEVKPTAQTEPISEAPHPPISKQENNDDRSHIKVIPRPPEWTMINSSDVSDSDDDYSYDSGDDSEDGGVEVDALKDTDAATALLTPVGNTERGTALSFPFLELHGIELLELISLNLTIKCERCKDTVDISGLKDSSPKTESCKKCAAALKVGFRRDLIHAHAVRAGFLDLEGCTIVDMLPSTFLPTCSNCSTPYPSPGIVSVRGETTTALCRTCHQKMTFSIPSVKFLRITAAAVPSASGPRKKRETLGLVTGTELPDRGRCKHYSKSYRWFRFSCCSKVYPCDKCHDEKEEHPNEHANRMICGWCSREQSYRPEECAFCGRGVVGRKGSGFWEGGKGTRDRVRMSRKDPRKYKRTGGPADKTKT